MVVKELSVARQILRNSVCAITTCAVTFGTVKRTIALIIILMVSMGYGVVRPTLGGLTTKVIMLEVLELVENVGAVSDLSGKARLFLVLPVAILDAFFVLWIFTSLSATLNKLQIYFKSNDVYMSSGKMLGLSQPSLKLYHSLSYVSSVLFGRPLRTQCHASEELDKDDITLTLIKPSPMPSKDVRSALEARAVQGSNGESNDDLEEKKSIVKPSRDD